MLVNAKHHTMIKCVGTIFNYKLFDAGSCLILVFRTTAVGPHCKINFQLINFHFIILLILVLNFIITISFDVELNNYIKIGLKILFYGSALICLFIFAEPFRLRAIYFLMCVITPLLCISESLLSELLTLLLFTSIPLYESNNYEIQSYSSPMGTCCQYQVYENYSPFIRFRGKFTYTEFTEVHGKQEEDLAPFSEIEKIKNIKIKKDSIFIDFEDNSTISFKLY